MQNETKKQSELIIWTHGISTELDICIHSVTALKNSKYLICECIIIGLNIVFNIHLYE
jgi:hypothetical protein